MPCPPTAFSISIHSCIPLHAGRLLLRGAGVSKLMFLFGRMPNEVSRGRYLAVSKVPLRERSVFGSPELRFNWCLAFSHPRSGCGRPPSLWQAKNAAFATPTHAAERAASKPLKAWQNHGVDKDWEVVRKPVEGSAAEGFSPFYIDLYYLYSRKNQSCMTWCTPSLNSFDLRVPFLHWC